MKETISFIKDKKLKLIITIVLLGFIIYYFGYAIGKAYYHYTN